MSNINKLAKFVESELSSDLRNALVSQDQAGKYYLFNKYVVVNDNFCFKVYCLLTNTVEEFISLKAATSWCVLDNAGRRTEARMLKRLDLKLSSIAVDIAVHKNIIKNAKNEFTTLISLTKLQEDNFKRRMILAELNTYINNSKRIQDKNFRVKDSKFKFVR